MSETCVNGCIPSSPRVGCPVHGPKAKPPEPEDLPHPGTGRLLSAALAAPPHGFIDWRLCRHDIRITECTETGCKEWLLRNPTPPHGKDAGEEMTPTEWKHADGAMRVLEAERDALQALIHTAADTLDIVAASPQDFVTHVLLLREERDELKARLTEAEGLLREYLHPGRNSPEDLDGDTRAFLKEGTK